MKLYNNNPEFGDAGPFEAESQSALAVEMDATFREWAEQRWLDTAESESAPNRHAFIERTVSEMRAEFIDGLTEVLHCDECGEDYHEDAPERGHASGCSHR